MDIENSLVQDNAFTFTLSKRQVSLDDFESFVKEIRATLREVTRAATDIKENWVLTGLRFGSAEIAVAPSSKFYSEEGLIARVVIDGFKAIASSTSKPSYFTDRALKGARRLSALTGDGTLKARSPDGQVAILDARSRDNIDALLRPAKEYFGSVVGSLDIVSVHKKPYVTIFGDHGDVVRCYIQNLLIDDAKDALGRRCIVSGCIRTNSLGDMISIKVDEIVDAPQRNHAPVSRFAGAIPDFTGGDSISEYLRISRGEVS